MKILYVPSKGEISISQSLLEKISEEVPDKVGIITTLQFSEIAKKIFVFFKKKKKKVFMYRGGLILGCDLDAARKIEKKVSSFLYIGSGNFHPLMVALSLKEKKPIFVFNPNTQQFYRFSEKEIEKIKNKRKAAYLQFLSSSRIGIFVSIKKGQARLSEALKIKNLLEKKGKKAYIFIADNFSSEQLENWKDLVWINTACPGISLEQNFLDVAFIKKILKEN